MDQSQIQSLLEAILGSDKVYFQPPPTVKMTYPAIVYSRDMAITRFADDSPYRYMKRYQVIVITTEPDSGIPDNIAALPMSVFDRFYTANNLNHDVFNVFF